MVSTRNHPSQFPPPTPTPTPATRSPSKGTQSVSPPPSPTLAVASKRAAASSSANGTASGATAATGAGAWSHTPSHLALLWLAVSLPLVIWDTGYVFLRPHSMPGGKWHRPVWSLYAIYASVDHVYGFPAWEAREGFTGAQSAMNTLETALYLVYLGVVVAYGRAAAERGRGAPGGKGVWGRLAEARRVGGRAGAVAVLLGFATAVMTTSKTMLYWLNEYCSGWKHTGHNDTISLILFWILPNGPWIIVPAYLAYVMGAEIIEGLEASSSKSARSKKTR